MGKENIQKTKSQYIGFSLGGWHAAAAVMASSLTLINSTLGFYGAGVAAQIRDTNF